MYYDIYIYIYVYIYIYLYQYLRRVVSGESKRASATRLRPRARVEATLHDRLATSGLIGFCLGKAALWNQ